MRPWRLIVLICISFISIVLHSTACAGNRVGAATVTLGAGYNYFSTKRHIENTGIPFVALGYDLTDRWGIEALIGNFSTSSKRMEEKDRQVRGTLFTVDGIYYFSSPYKIEPYVLAGVGILGMNPNGRDASNAGNINAGAGAQIFIDKSIAFRVEARDLYTIVSGYHDIFLNGGVSFLFDLC